MKYQPGLLENFISALTGELSEDVVIPLGEDYILIGNKDGKGTQSLILKDLLLDFQSLRANLDQSTFILQKPIDFLGNAQALNKLEDGLLKHHEGVVQIAIPDVDYVSDEKLQEYVKEAQDAAKQAQQSASDAANSAGQAKQSSDAAELAKSLASVSASQASLSANAASLSAATAVESATAAAGSAAAAVGSAAAAALSAAAALASSIAASSSADDAKQYRDEALSYRDQAQMSATAAADSAKQASDYLQQLLNTGISLVGDVVGSGPLKDPINLELMLPLNKIKKPIGDVDMNNHALINLETLNAATWQELEAKAQNGINFLFLWQLFGGSVR